MKGTRLEKLWLPVVAVIMLSVFIFFRPLNSPQYRVIVADGLGYYAYLPAQFIYNDQDLTFSWFSDVYKKYYEDQTFNHPTEHFLVSYQDKKINLYYPGVSLLQTPFFMAAHCYAKVSGAAADGYSTPYQVAMGLSAIFYTLLGLLITCRMITSYTGNSRAAILAVLLVLTGTQLFTYSVYNGCYSHCYSFFAIALFYYFVHKFFSEARLHTIAAVALSAALVVTIRPVNLLALPGAFFFYRRINFIELKNNVRTIPLICILALLFLILYYNFSIAKTQTGSVIANTYTIGKFLWYRWDRIITNLFGFQVGVLWYSPVLLIAVLPVLFIRRQPRILFLYAVAGGMFVIYSLWWYWTILGRTLVDLSAIFAILLGILFSFEFSRKSVKKWLTIFSVAAALLFQLKAYQLRNGILDSNYTYWKYYVKHFFTLSHVDVYPVNPRDVIFSEDHFFDFENDNSNMVVKNVSGFESKKSLVLDEREYANVEMMMVPRDMGRNGFPKIKVSFWFWRGEGMDDVQLVLSLQSQSKAEYGKVFYINTTTPSGKWVYKEFGYDMPPGGSVEGYLRMYFWNPSKKSASYIDNFKLEYLLTNGSSEITDE